jgi:hypothetical protein
MTVAKVSTDGDGRFRFVQLPAGIYSAVASKPFFVTSAYGARRPGEPGTPIELGAEVTNLNVRLVATGRIRGSIRRPDGTAFGGLIVEALRWTVTPLGIRALTVISTTRSDDRGSYDLKDLRPDEYLVRARPGILIVHTPTSPSGHDPTATGYVPTYYPGVLDPINASTVVSGAAGVTENPTIVMRVTTFARVDGRIDSGHGSVHLTTGDVVLHRLENPGLPPIVAGTDGDRYWFSAVPAGDYLLVARKDRDQTVDFARIGMRRLAVASGQLSDVNVTLQPQPTISGLIKASDEPLPSEGLRLRLSPVDGGTRIASATTAVTRQDFRFELRAATPGWFRIGVGDPGVPLAWKRASVEIGGNVVDDGRLQLSPGEHRSGVTINVTSRLSTLSGEVVDEKGQPQPQHTVVMLPRDAALRSDHERIFSARPSQKGRFVFRQVIRGDYLLALLDDPSQNEWLLPNVMARLEQAGTPISINSSDQAVRLLVSTAQVRNGRH